MPQIRDLLNNWKSTLATLAALLIVIVSVINGVNDIIVAWRGLPIGETEKINHHLFKEHWKEDPIHTKQIVIEGNKGNVPITIDVYANGDIFVDYVRLTQWFPYSDVITQKEFHIINSAYAGFLKKASKKIRSESSSIKNEKASANTVKRTRNLEDGSKEIQTININTGKITNVETVEPEENAETMDSSKRRRSSDIEVIRLPGAKNDKAGTIE